MRWHAAGSILVLCLLAFSGRANDAKSDLKALQGTWDVTELVAPERRFSGDELKSLKIKRFIITSDRIVMGEGDDKREFSIKLDPSQKPKAIDLTMLHGPFKGMTTQAIYEVSADKLKLCVANGTIKERPKEFKAAKEGQLVVFTLNRGK